MFKQISISGEQAFRNSGCLLLHTCEPHSAKLDEWKPLPYKIVYKSSQNNPTELFNLTLTITSSSLIIDNLDTSSGALLLEESAMHMFLGWTLQKFKTWTLSYRKGRLMVQSKLPHITEWFVEHGYSIKKTSALTTEKVFVGFIKSLI